ncbi:Os05g0583000, partial [Oryza sativa Japonica Group]
ATCGVHDQERGRPPRGRLPVAQVRPESRQEQLLPKLLPVHGAAVRGEEAGGEVGAGPVHGDHHIRRAAHAPEPRELPHAQAAGAHACERARCHARRRRRLPVRRAAAAAPWLRRSPRRSVPGHSAGITGRQIITATEVSLL